MKHIKTMFSIGIGLAIIALTGLSITGSLTARAHGSKTCDASKDAFCLAPQVNQKLERLESIQLPKIATPAWLGEQSSPQPVTVEVRYEIATRGNVSADFTEFKSQVNETLNSPLGWSRLGVRFVPVESDGQFTVWLSESSQVPSFSPSGCDTVVSCRVGRNVVINETRWLNGSDAWNAGGGSLRDYRHMVVNHETGHWLGHGHQTCGGAGQSAPLMQQQTISLQGCTPNAWPLATELYSSTLGIRS